MNLLLRWISTIEDSCVIAELFLEGSSIFTLSQLLKYRSKEYSPDANLDKIEDEDIKVKGIKYQPCRTKG